MKRLLLSLVFLSVNCAATQRVVLKRCPTIYALAADVLVSGVALAASVLAYNAGEYAKTGGYLGAFGGIVMSANLSECQ